MGYFDELVKEEIKNQKNKLDSIKSFLRGAPEGEILGKKRESYTSYYHVVNDEKTNISKDKRLIVKLIKKRIALLQIPYVKNNIKRLETLYKHYPKGDMDVILNKLPSWYADALKDSYKQSVKQNKAIFNPKYHIHETQAGILVRSKSEVIIVNTLYKYGISFEYETPFEIHDVNGEIVDIFYPDFTIILPNGKKKIWEHFGLLSNPSYCDKTSRKLKAFQNEGYQLYDDLLITMDNNKGSCNSQVIDQLVRDKLLRY